MKLQIPFALFICTLLMVMPLQTIQANCLAEKPCANDSSSPGLSAAEIAAYPEPLVEPLTIDAKLLYDRWYHRVNGTVPVFDAPDGTQTRTIDEGFNFVTVLETVNGWAHINPGEWVKLENLTESSSVVTHFTGVLLPEKAPPYQAAWALINMYPSRTPGGNPSESNPIVYRYTRLNLYATVEVEGETWYQIGVDEWVHQHHVARIAPIERPAKIDTDHWISIDLYEQTVTAYEGEQPVFVTLISSGRSIWPTNEGLYHIYFRRMRKDMSGGKVGDDYYYLEEVPWTMFFDEGRALHGEYWHDGLGYRRSHGCINMSITDAHWLYDWVAEEMGTMASAEEENGPAVYVYSSGEYQ